jgi:hypothetical protein
MFRTILGSDQASSVKNTEINKQSQSSGAIWGETGNRSYLDFAKLIKIFYVRPNIDSGAPYGLRPVIPVRPRSYLD